MLKFGSAVFKIARLLVIACFSVHIFACIFFRVKKESAAPDAVQDFYLARGVDPAVSPRPAPVPPPPRPRVPPPRRPRGDGACFAAHSCRTAALTAAEHRPRRRESF